MGRQLLKNLIIPLILISSTAETLGWHEFIDCRLNPWRWESFSKLLWPQDVNCPSNERYQHQIQRSPTMWTPSLISPSPIDDTVTWCTSFLSKHLSIWPLIEGDVSPQTRWIGRFGFASLLTLIGWQVLISREMYDYPSDYWWSVSDPVDVVP